MTKKPRKNPSAREKLDDAIRFGQIHLAVHILGYANLGHITGAYCITELSGKMFIVRMRGNSPYCTTCQNDNDDHTSLVRLYRARLGDPKGP
jgi:hypothetical protein